MKTPAERRLVVATSILNGMIASAPIADRSSVDKNAWANIALDWADALVQENDRRTGYEQR